MPEGALPVAALQAADRERVGRGGEGHRQHDCDPLSKPPPDGQQAEGNGTFRPLDDYAYRIPCDPGKNATHDQRHPIPHGIREDGPIQASNPKTEISPVEQRDEAQKDTHGLSTKCDGRIWSEDHQGGDRETRADDRADELSCREGANEMVRVRPCSIVGYDCGEMK